MRLLFYEGSGEIKGCTTLGSDGASWVTSQRSLKSTGPREQADRDSRSLAQAADFQDTS